MPYPKPEKGDTRLSVFICISALKQTIWKSELTFNFSDQVSFTPENTTHLSTNHLKPPTGKPKETGVCLTARKHNIPWFLINFSIFFLITGDFMGGKSTLGSTRASQFCTSWVLGCETRPRCGISETGSEIPKNIQESFIFDGDNFLYFIWIWIVLGYPKNEKNSDSLVNHDSPIRTAINSDIPQFQTRTHTQ